MIVHRKTDAASLRVFGGVQPLHVGEGQFRQQGGREVWCRRRAHPDRAEGFGADMGAWLWDHVFKMVFVGRRF